MRQSESNQQCACFLHFAFDTTAAELSLSETLQPTVGGAARVLAPPLPARRRFALCCPAGNIPSAPVEANRPSCREHGVHRLMGSQAELQAAGNSKSLGHVVEIPPQGA